MTHGEKPFDNIVGKGENAGNQHFHLFPQCYLPFPKPILGFLVAFILLSSFSVVFYKSKICHLLKS